MSEAPEDHVFGGVSQSPERAVPCRKKPTGPSTTAVSRNCGDEEVGAAGRRVMKEHLSLCLSCRRRLTSVRENQELVAAKLTAFLSVIPGEKEGGSPAKGVFFLQPRSKKMLVPVAAAVLLAGVLSYAPARTMAGNLLSIFRVQNVQTISLSHQDVTRLRSLFAKGGRVDIRNFGRIEISGRASWRQVSPAEAGGALGVPVTVPPAPAGFTAPTIRLSDPSSITMTLDVKNINAYLSSLGDSTLLPAGLEGKPFTVSVPSILQIRYIPVAAGGPPVTVSEAGSPQLAIPDGVDPNVLKSALLGIPGLPSDLTSQLAAVNDWRHTLLIPSVDGHSTNVEVDGTRGVFVNPSKGHPAEGKGQNALVFEKNGVVYAVYGPLTRQEAISIGDQLS